MGVYEEMAELYDLIYGEDYDLGLFLEEARWANGPVLEVACGTGRVLLHLLSNGIDAVGIDMSGSMLAVLKRKAKALGLEPDVRIADMRSFHLDRKFRLIIVPCRTFAHMMDDEDRKRALRCFYEHLEDGGKLIIDMINPSGYELGMRGGFHPYDSMDMVSPDGKPYKLEWSLRYDPEGDVARYKAVITMDGKKRSYTTVTTYVFPERMRELLEGCGFKVKAYHDVGYEPFTGQYGDIFWFAEK